MRLGNLGIALGAGVDEYRRGQEQDRRERAEARAEEDQQLQRQSAAQLMAMRGIQIDQARDQKSDDDAIRGHLKQTLGDLEKIRQGDFSPIQRLGGIYNRQEEPFNNGNSVAIQSVPGGMMVNHLDADGKILDSVKIDKSNAERMYLRAAEEQMKYISPRFYSAAMAKSAELEAKQAELNNKKDIAKIYADSRMYGADVRADASMYGADQRNEASRYSADRRPVGKTGGLTLSQQRQNAEIDAAREAVSGMDPEEIRKRTAKTTDTGRENPDYDSTLAKAASLANRRKIGADDVFDQRNAGNREAQPPQPSQLRSREAIAKEFRSDRQMDNYRLGRDTEQGVEVLDKQGRVVGYYN